MEVKNKNVPVLAEETLEMIAAIMPASTYHSFETVSADLSRYERAQRYRRNDLCSHQGSFRVDHPGTSLIRSFQMYGTKILDICIKAKPVTALNGVAAQPRPQSRQTSA